MQRRYWVKLDADGDPKLNEDTDEPILEPVSVSIGSSVNYWLDEGMASGYLARPKRDTWEASYEDALGNEITHAFDRAWKAFDWLEERLNAKLDGNSLAFCTLINDAPALVGADAYNAYVVDGRVSMTRDGRVHRVDVDGAFAT